MTIACQEKPPVGSLLVRASNAGSYEIYRIASSKPFQFVSEQIGFYNQPLKLPLGEYLILADCSHQRLHIQPNQQLELMAHLVEFTPPGEPNDRDSFSIQCDRFSKTRLRQHLLNRYRLNILHGNREMLVAMVPFHIDFAAQGYTEPQTLSFDLAAVRLKAYDGMNPKTSYFVSPAAGLISVTRDQEFGHWQFLLPGDYSVAVNGTEMNIQLHAREKREITPSFLRVTVDDQVDLNLSSNILGTPLYLELNNDHWLNLNETYPVLPGEATIKLNGSKKSYPITLEEGKVSDHQARSLVVEFDCPPWDWTCLGSHKVYLYNTGKSYPFAEGISDVPILFFEPDAWVSIQGSRDLRYHLDPEQNDFRLRVGSLELTPDYHYRPNHITDLTRIEAIDEPYAGHTLDLPLERQAEVPLIAGSYHLAQYTSIYGNEYERRPIKKWFHIGPHERKDMTYPVLVSEKKYKQLKKAQKRLEARRQSRRKKQIANRFQPIIPLSIH
jgi:hypothetical protein